MNKLGNLKSEQSWLIQRLTFCALIDLSNRRTHFPFHTSEWNGRPSVSSRFPCSFETHSWHSVSSSDNETYLKVPRQSYQPSNYNPTVERESFLLGELLASIKPVEEWLLSEVSFYLEFSSRYVVNWKETGGQKGRQKKCCGGRKLFFCLLFLSSLTTGIKLKFYEDKSASY